MHLTDAVLAELADTAGFVDAAIIVRSRSPGGRGAEFQPRRPLYPASMIKLPIAFALEESRARGLLSLDDRVTVSSADITTNDAPSIFASGHAARLGELGHAMLAASDNVATNVLITALGRAAISETGVRLGLRDTHVRRKLSGSLPLIDDPGATGRNVHPADDCAALLERLARNGPPWIATALAAQIWNDKLSRGFEPGDTFAHKTGDTDEVSHDAGLLTLSGGERYTIVVYTALASNAESDARHAAFARALRPYLGARAQGRVRPQ